MYVDEKKIKLKDGQEVVLRSPTPDDGEAMIKYVVQASGETEFLLRYPEEYADLTMEREIGILQASIDNPDGCMIACFVDDRVVGNCQIVFYSTIKQRHKAIVAIGILQDYWNLGLGTALFQEMFGLAEERGGVRQIELDFIEGNDRAKALYEKMGFQITGTKLDSIRLKDGSFRNEYMMMKWL